MGDGIAEPVLTKTLRYDRRSAWVAEREQRKAVYSTSSAHGGEVLIGSCAMMLNAFQTAVNVLGLSLQRAVDMCCCSPAKIARLPHTGSLHVGMRADMVLLNEKLEVNAVF